MTFQNTWFAAILCAVFLTGCGKSPESTVENFYKAVAKGEITEAQSYVSAQLVGMLGQPKLSTVLSAQTEQIRACGGIKNVTVKLQGEGEVRTGTSTVTYSENCPPKTEKTKLVKEDGEWKITANK
ncbi:MAG TPA: DUF4878 domain-containing protein [Gallionella sp.]|nr:DUF4878 domain-containing protein [Gallionella sp.]